MNTSERAERLTCDHCKQRITTGTCHRTEGGIEYWCDRCLDADEASWATDAPVLLWPGRIAHPLVTEAQWTAQAVAWVRKASR
jgi:hypothetical protein